MPKNLKQKFMDFCKKYGRLKFERNTTQCYIKPETIVERSSDFSLAFQGLVDEFAKGWLAVVVPNAPDVRFGLYKYPFPKQAKGINMEMTVHRDAEEVVLVLDHEGFYIEGKKGDKSGCGLRVGKSGYVSTFCIYVAPEYVSDVRISSVSSYANI